MNGTGLIPIVLAAGSSTRMAGANKLLLPVDGEALVRRVVRCMAEGTATAVRVVLGPEPGAVVEALAGLDVQVIQNPGHASGMASSVVAGVAAAPTSAAGYLLCVADLPLLEAQMVRAVADAFTAAGGLTPVVPSHRGRPGHPVAIPASYRDDLLGLQGDRGARSLLEGTRILDLPLGTPGILTDIDSPDDYRAVKGSTRHG